MLGAYINNIIMGGEGGSKPKKYLGYHSLTFSMDKVIFALGKADFPLGKVCVALGKVDFALGKAYSA